MEAGCRLSEALALKREHVDLQSGLANLQYTKGVRQRPGSSHVARCRGFLRGSRAARMLLCLLESQDWDAISEDQQYFRACPPACRPLVDPTKRLSSRIGNLHRRKRSTVARRASAARAFLSPNHREILRAFFTRVCHYAFGPAALPSQQLLEHHTQGFRVLTDGGSKGGPRPHGRA